jgi:two-component system, OmpR family, sensor kinase
MLAHSIRWRLQLWLAFLLIFLLIGFGVSVDRLLRIDQLRQIDEDLDRRVSVLSIALRQPPPEHGRGHHGFDGRLARPDFGNDFNLFPPPGNPPGGGIPGIPPDMRFGPIDFKLSPRAESLFDDEGTNSFYFAIWSRNQTLLKRSTNAPANLVMPHRVGNDTRTHARMRGEFRELYHFTELGDCVLAGRFIATDLEASQHFSWVILAAGSAVLALGLGVGWWLTSRAIRPLEDISTAARRISAGNLSERIKVPDPLNEIGNLAEVLNSTFARLESTFEQQKQFTADASHELRTPLAVIISEAQTVLARERNASEYRETVEVCLETAQQMKRLIESLLELARLDVEEERTRPVPFNLAGNVLVCLERVHPIAVRHGIQIHHKLEPAMALGNADRFSQVVTNLLTNAIYYNRLQGQIFVETRVEKNSAVVTVRDTGQGISPEDLPHIFKRFYRADKSRSQAGGHSGLGLAICKAILEADGGSIDVTSEVGVGSTFSVRLPSAPQST